MMEQARCKQGRLVPAMSDFAYPLDNKLEDRIVEALAGISLDYTEELAFIRRRNKEGAKWAAAGVLVLIGKYPADDASKRGYFFLMNKRSAHVQQAGDLCFPGGHPQRWVDCFLSSLIRVHYSIKNGSGFKMLKQRDRTTFKKAMYFFGNGLRESYEEIRLNPFKVAFLGALRCYKLELFNRIIFPLVGLIKEEVKIKPNWEVERIIRIPIESLLIPENYALYKLMVKGRFQARYQTDWVTYDCFVHRETGKEDEILWGASYSIVQSFLKAVFDFVPPSQQLRLKTICGELYPEIS